MTREKANNPDSQKINMKQDEESSKNERDQKRNTWIGAQTQAQIDRKLGKFWSQSVTCIPAPRTRQETRVCTGGGQRKRSVTSTLHHLWAPRAALEHLISFFLFIKIRRDKKTLEISLLKDVQTRLVGGLLKCHDYSNTQLPEGITLVVGWLID